MTTTYPDVRATAVAALAAGLSIVPPAEDGTKKPFVAWNRYQRERPTLDELRAWYGPPGSPPRCCGLGAVTGEASGNLEVLEFDACGRTYEPFKAAAQATGLGDLVERIEAGYFERSPSGGLHYLYRCETIAGNTKLASYDSDELGPTGKPIRKALIETRGEGGYIVVAPSGGSVHPSGEPYVLLRGGFNSIATIAPEERELLWELARSFDEILHEDPTDHVEAKSRAEPTAGWDDVVSPIDDYNARVTWPEVLPTGWAAVFAQGDTQYWRRPGKAQGISATINRNGSNRLFVFSTSAGFGAEKPYSKAGAYALLNHGGDFSAAVAALSKAGYGTFKTWVRRAGEWVLETRPNPCPKGVRIAKPGDKPPGNDARSGARVGPQGAQGASATGDESDKDIYKDATPEQLGVIDSADVEIEDPVWLWQYRFLIGKINTIAGEGGDGKTTVAIAVGAVVTRGGTFADGYPAGEAGVVMVLAAEDGIGDTLLPRFIAAGADVSRGQLKFLTASVCIPATGDRPAMVNPVSLQDLTYWRHIFNTFRPRLLVINPLPAYMGRGVNDHKNNEVQTVLNAFAKVASDFNVCVIAITHTGKSVDRKLIHKILGSVAYTNVSRVVHVTIRDPDDRTVRYLERPKCNLDGPRDALVYRLIPTEFEHKGKVYRTSKAEFQAGTVAIDAEAMSNPKSDGKPKRERDATRENQVAERLVDFLDGRPGWTPRKDVFAAAGEAGLIGTFNKVSLKWSNGTLIYRAKDRVPELPEPRGGKRIEEQDMATESDRYPRICLRLMGADMPY